MVEVYYSRSPLAVFRAQGASSAEILDFLNRYSPLSYELVSEPEDRPIRVRASWDRSTVITLVESTLMIHDPDIGGISFSYTLESLRRFGLDPDRLQQLFQGE